MSRIQTASIRKKEPSGRAARPLPPLILAASLVLFSGCGGREGNVTPNPRSNVLLITMDTTRADRLGSSGYPAASTPNLDSLAGSGVSFADAYSPVPLTLPAHCTILSGLYPLAHKVRNNGNYSLPGQVTTLAEMLGRRGYQTSAFVSSFVLDSRFGLGRGFSVYDDDFASGGAKTYRSERNADAVLAAFSRWLAGRAQGRFFSWVHFFDPHAPYDPPEPYRQRFAGSLYDGEIAFMDHAIGGIMALLKEKGLLADTLVVVAGDHGEAFGEHGEFGHQVFCYGENLRVPLIFNAPGHLPKNLRLRQAACLTDILPTILDFLQARSPSRSRAGPCCPPCARPRSPRKTSTWKAASLSKRSTAPRSRASSGKTSNISTCPSPSCTT